MVVSRPLWSELLELGFVGDGDGLTAEGGCGGGTMPGNQQPERMGAGLGAGVVPQGVDLIHSAVTRKEAGIGKEDVLVRVSQGFQHFGHGAADEFLEAAPVGAGLIHGIRFEHDVPRNAQLGSLALHRGQEEFAGIEALGSDALELDCSVVEIFGINGEDEVGTLFPRSGEFLLKSLGFGNFLADSFSRPEMVDGARAGSDGVAPPGAEVDVLGLVGPGTIGGLVIPAQREADLFQQAVELGPSRQGLGLRVAAGDPAADLIELQLAHAK